MSNPKSTLQIAGHPVHVMLVPFVIGGYAGTFAADLVYAGTQDPFWARAAFWLLVIGVVFSALAATAGLIDFLCEPKIRALRAAWLHFIGNATLALISIVDLYLRYVDGYEAGSRSCIWLAGIAFALLLFNGWQGWQMVYRHHVAISD
jgi:uncharacterized membrane protein